MADDGELSGEISIPLVWAGGEELPVVRANQFLLQVDQDGDIFLSVGTALPPALIPSNPADLQGQIESLTYLPIQTVAKLSLSPRSVDELAELLRKGREMHDRRTEEGPR